MVDTQLDNMPVDAPSEEPPSRNARRNAGPPWLLPMLVGLLLIAAALMCQVSGLPQRLRPLATATPSPTATVTWTPAPSLTATATATLAPTATVAPTSIPIVRVGALAVVSGTGTDHLRLRTGPGLGYEILLTMPDGTVLRVVEGPVEADAHRWWRVEVDEQLTGWAVAAWLAPVTP